MSAIESIAEENLLGVIVGERVRHYRTARGWTLDELAARSEVSRRSVINIEQGGSNSSIALLLRLSTALGVSLSELVELNTGNAVSLKKAGSQQVLWNGPNGGTGILLGSLPAPNVVELWQWTLEPGESHESEAHSKGTSEILHVLNGKIELAVGSETFALGAGDSVTFNSDVAHSYSCIGARSARFTLSVYQPGVKT